MGTGGHTGTEVPVKSGWGDGEQGAGEGSDSLNKVTFLRGALVPQQVPHLR